MSVFLAFTAVLVLSAAAFVAVNDDQQLALRENQDIELLAVRDGVYVVGNAGSKITVFVGDEGVLLVDTHFRVHGKKILAAIRSVTSKPIRYIVNTHGHPDHVDGNAFFKNEANIVDGLGGDVSIIAHEGVIQNMIDSGYGDDWMPTELYSDNGRRLLFGGESIHIAHFPMAHTGGDSIVFFESSNVISIGDLYNDVTYPFVDRWKGGSTTGLLAALDSILLIVDRHSSPDSKTVIIASHGSVLDRADIVELRDMIEVVSGRVSEMVREGLSRRQIQARNPTAEYDATYAQWDGIWTPSAFVNAVYTDVVKSADPVRTW